MPSVQSERKLQTLADVCLIQAEICAESIAVIDAGEALTYAALSERARRLSGVLIARGVQPGDRVVVCGRNSVGWVSIAFGVLLAGAIVVPFGFANSDRERRAVVASTQPVLFVAEDPSVDVDQLLSFAELLEAGTKAPLVSAAELPHVHPDDLALIMSTSGSTGMPKQVPMAHGQLVQVYSSVAELLGLTSADRLLGATPLAHSFGFNGVLLSGLLSGAAVRLVWHYDRSELADLVVSEQLTSVFGPPTIVFDLVNGGRSDLGVSCRRIICGGADVPLEQLRSACEHLGIPQMFVGYGLTETYGTVAIGDARDVGPGVLPMLTPLEGIEVMVVDDDGQPVLSGEDGHILCRGHNVFAGYYGNLEATRGAIDDEGWLHTGDIGLVDSLGRLCVASRATDMLVVSGFNVYPREVEHVLLEHPSVSEVVVVGIPDERQGEQLVGCVVPLPGHRLDTGVLMAHCREHLTAYKVPRLYVVLDALPTTHTGKRSRPAMRALAIQKLAT